MIGNLMSQALQFLNGFLNNYGLSIIIFTLIIKLILYPSTLKQNKSMKEMQELQPQIKKIQEKYKDNKEKQQEEMMKLYQENKINPAAGCLPMIIQMIIIIPLYRSILGLQEAMGTSTFLWIDSLAQPDLVLVIINGLATVGQTYITQKLSGNTTQNSAFMWFMPIMIIFIGLKLPAGVLLYWLTSTIFTTVQQYINYRDPVMKGAEGKK